MSSVEGMNRDQISGRTTFVIVAKKMGPQIALEQKRSKVIFVGHCCARMIWACISARMAEDVTMTLHNISERMNWEAKMNRDHISSRTTCDI
jgi:hypothetical protein